MEEIAGELAFSGKGVVKRKQLLLAGVTPSQIRSRLRSGVFLVEHPGIYRVGHRAPTLESAYLAAVWACGDEALLCGLAAAHLYGTVKGKAPPREVLAPNPHRVAGVVTRRTRRLDPREATKWRGIPVTTVPRTLVDIAPRSRVDDLARVCHEAAVRYGVKPSAVEALLLAAGPAARTRGARPRGELRRYSWDDVFGDSTYMRAELGLLLRE